MLKSIELSNSKQKDFPENAKLLERGGVLQNDGSPMSEQNSAITETQGPPQTCLSYSSQALC